MTGARGEESWVPVDWGVREGVEEETSDMS